MFLVLLMWLLSTFVLVLAIDHTLVRRLLPCSRPGAGQGACAGAPLPLRTRTPQQASTRRWHTKGRGMGGAVLWLGVWRGGKGWALDHAHGWSMPRLLLQVRPRKDINPTTSE